MIHKQYTGFHRVYNKSFPVLFVKVAFGSQMPNSVRNVALPPSSTARSCTERICVVLNLILWYSNIIFSELFLKVAFGSQLPNSVKNVALQPSSTALSFTE